MERTVMLMMAVFAVVVGGTSAADKYTVNGTGPCTATVMKNGAAYKMINLTTLDSKNPAKPMFTVKGKLYTYLYNPCTGIKMATACVTNEAVCQTKNGSATGVGAYSAGKQNFTSFNMSTAGIIMMQYTEDPTNAASRRSIFTLMCLATATAPTVVFNTENPAGHYNFNFTWAPFCNLTSDMVGQGVQGSPIDIGPDQPEHHLTDLEEDDEEEIRL